MTLSVPSGGAPVTDAAQTPSHHAEGAVQGKVSGPRSSFTAEQYKGLPSSILEFPKLVPWVIQSGSGNRMDPIQNSIHLTSVENYIYILDAF